MAAPQVKIEKAGLYKMISYKGTSGAAKKYTPMTAAKRLGEIENSMTVGMASVVSGINSLRNDYDTQKKEIKTDRRERQEEIEQILLEKPEELITNIETKFGFKYVE